jgi:hypothetical protein
MMMKMTMTTMTTMTDHDDDFDDDDDDDDDDDNDDFYDEDFWKLRQCLHQIVTLSVCIIQSHCFNLKIRPVTTRTIYITAIF